MDIMNSQVNKSSTALLVPSCDNYIDVIDQFFDRQEKFMGWWNFPRYVLIEEGDYAREGVITLKSSKQDAWADRIRKNVEQLDEEYFLFLLDDYFLSAPISEPDILEAIKIMKAENIRYYKLVNNPKVNNPYPNHPYLSEIPDNLRYGINLAECIMRKDFLLELLHHGMNIWDVEAYPLSSVKEIFTGYLDGCVTDTRDILKTKYAIMHGRWVLPTVWYFKKSGMPISIGTRGVSKPWQLITVQFDIFVNRYISMRTIRAAKKFLGKFGRKFASKY